MPRALRIPAALRRTASRRKRRAPADITHSYIQNSKCIVGACTHNIRAASNGFESSPRLISLSIQFEGDAARIPNLKSNKMPGHSFVNPETVARLVAMDKLYLDAWRSTGLDCNFGDDAVFITLFNGRRSCQFDVDNCLVTLRDWLEPPTKKVGTAHKFRGWGVGAINNDSSARGISLKWSDLDLDFDFTYIEITRLSAAREHLSDFLGKMTGVKSLFASSKQILSEKKP